jgi:hypothetical protein
MSQSISKSGRLKNNLWFAYIVLLVFWSICAYSEIGRMVQRHELFARDIDHHPYISDFINHYYAGQLAADCSKTKLDIYSPQLQADYAKKLTAPVVAEQPFYLQYPPYWFSLCIPLTCFDLLSAWLIWCSVGVFLYIMSAILLTRTAAGVEDQIEIAEGAVLESGKKIFGVGKFTLSFIIIASVASFPTWYSVKVGQPALFVLPGLVAFWLLCRKRRYFLAGLASCVTMVKLQYLPPIFVIGCLLGRGRFLGGFTLIALLLLGLALGTLGADNVMRFPQALLQGEGGQSVSGVAADEMQNLRGTLNLLVGSDSSVVHYISIAAFALALAGLTFLWWRATKTWWRNSQDETSKGRGASQFRVLASISTLVILAVSPHCHVQDYLAVVLPCIWLWFEIAKLKENGNTSKSLTFLQGMIILFPLLGWPFFFLKIFFQLAKIQPFFLWAVVVIILSYRLYDRNK